VYKILKRACGVNVRGKTLLQVPTVHEVSGQEVQFALKVEELLSSITIPEYRQVIVEMLMVVSTVLERNPEINYSSVLKLDELLEESVHLYTMDQGQEKGEGSKEAVEDDCAGFYALLPDGMSGSISYMAKAVVNRLLQQGLIYDISKQCCIS
jgi:phosphorylase kinase alpha/beta subunit